MPDVYRVALSVPRTFKSDQFVYATPDGQLVARGEAIGDWEPFTLRFPRELVVG
jgi:hypothetical protein